MKIRMKERSFIGIRIMRIKNRWIPVAAAMLLMLGSYGCGSESREPELEQPADNDDISADSEETQAYVEGRAEAQYVIDHISEIVDSYDKDLEIDTTNNKDTNEMLLESYPAHYHDETTIIEGLSIDRNYDIGDEAYHNIELEISAIAELNHYTNIESVVSEYNENGGFITYVVRYDNSVCYYITAFIDQDKSYYGQVCTLEDNGYASSAFENK